MISNMNAERVEFVLNEGHHAMSSLERWAYPHRSQNIQVPALTLDSALAGWERLDVVKDRRRGRRPWWGRQASYFAFLRK